MSVFTILGADGFIGSHLVEHLLREGHRVHAVGRGNDVPSDAGHVFYCIGLTADFRERPFDTVKAHIGILHDDLQALHFDSFTYLSSTRVYQHLAPHEMAREESPLTVNPNDASDLYNLSKLMGESLCLTHKNPAVRVVRLSNVYGGRDRSENFLSSILRDAIENRRVLLRTPPDAEKDYIGIDDVLAALKRIPERANSRLINVAAGRNTSNAEIANLLRHYTGCIVETEPSSSSGNFPVISIDRLRNEIGIVPKNLDDNFEDLVENCRANSVIDNAVAETPPDHRR